MGSASGSMDADGEQARAGLTYALVANALWGLMPVYFRALAEVPAIEVLAHRILWSVLLLFGIHFVRHAAALPNTDGPRLLRLAFPLTVTGLLLAAQWLAYIYAVFTHQVFHSSLGYFMAPLVNVLFSVWFLRDRLSKTQAIGVVLALLGTLNLCWAIRGLPWIALVIGLAFGLYALVRKQLTVDSVTGLLIEMAILLGPAILVLVHAGTTGAIRFGNSWSTSLLLISSGAWTVAPLLAYNGATRRLRLSTLGVMQFLSPTLQFVLALFAYGEPISLAQLLSFALIWAAVILYSLEGVCCLIAQSRG
jgi:chloramphenicol-sensitive protein RarD